MEPKRQDEERDELEEPERAPSLLSARELQARDPGPAPEVDSKGRAEPNRKVPRKAPASTPQKRSK